MTVGVLAAFIQLTRRFFQPLQDLSEKFNLLQSAMASSERVFRLLDEPVHGARAVAAASACRRPVRGEVRFDGVWFRYSEDGPWVLKDVSFRARPGRRWRWWATPGRGRPRSSACCSDSTIRSAGRITVDGVDIRELSDGRPAAA